jgi:hypothetical protein
MRDTQLTVQNDKPLRLEFVPFGSQVVEVAERTRRIQLIERLKAMCEARAWETPAFDVELHSMLPEIIAELEKLPTIIERYR